MPTIKTVFNMARCDENWELSEKWCTKIFSRVMMSESPEWVILFPEVNIFTPAGSYLQRAQSERYFLPYLDHTLYPRFSGLYNTMQMVRKSIKFSTIYDLTIMYDKEPPTLLQLFACPGSITISIHVKATSIARIPERRSKLERWLEKAWVDKEKLLAARSKSREMDDINPESQLILDVPLSSIFNLRI